LIKLFSGIAAKKRWPGKFIYVTKDAEIYLNCKEQQFF
jgi:hypothetical protein